jgi:hypothetical protein
MTRLATLALLLVSFASVSAQDFAGKWSGSFVTTRPDGTPGNERIYLEIKQTGTEVTGTAGPNVEKQWPLKGKVESGKLMFEVQSEGPLIKFMLALSEGHLKGEASAEDGGRKLTAQVDAERVK